MKSTEKTIIYKTYFMKQHFSYGAETYRLYLV